MKRIDFVLEWNMAKEEAYDHAATIMRDTKDGRTLEEKIEEIETNAQVHGYCVSNPKDLAIGLESSGEDPEGDI